MRKTEHAAEAIKHLNGYNLHGRNIRVDYSATPKAHNPTPGQYMGEKKPICECASSMYIDLHQTVSMIDTEEDMAVTTDDLTIEEVTTEVTVMIDMTIDVIGK